VRRLSSQPISVPLYSTKDGRLDISAIDSDCERSINTRWLSRLLDTLQQSASTNSRRADIVSANVDFLGDVAEIEFIASGTSACPDSSSTAKILCAISLNIFISFSFVVELLVWYWNVRSFSFAVCRSIPVVEIMERLYWRIIGLVARRAFHNPNLLATNLISK
jgi:hypothetical protein